MEGKTALVVGGLGQIGINTVKILLEAGAIVEVLDVQSEEQNQRAIELRANYSKNNLLFSKVDITEEDSVAEKISDSVKNFQTIDILINHAHYKGDPELLKPHSEFFSSVEDYPFEIWKETINVNLNGLFLVTKYVGSIMKAQQYGVMVNTASTYGIVSPNKSIYGESGINSPVSYAVTKSAILNFSRYLATHWADNNIRVNTISPGGVDNPGQSEEFKKNYSNFTPLKRLAKENEYQGAVLFLASEASAYMTGSNLIIDGGWTAW